MKRSSANGFNRSPLHLLHRAGQCADGIFETEMKISGLTPRQFAVLWTVAQSEGLSQTGIMERTSIDRSTMADIVRRLKDKGLVQRSRVRGDARTYAVKLTNEGRRVLRTVEPLAKSVDNRVLSALPPKQRELLLDALQMIVTAFQEMVRTRI